MVGGPGEGLTGRPHLTLRRCEGVDRPTHTHPATDPEGNDEQERRFRKRIYHPTKHWKLSPMDLQSRARWVEYSKAKDEMFAHTDIKQAPWYVVHGDDKERARLNVMTHLLSLIDYEDLTPERIELPPRQEDQGYVRPPMSDQTFIPEIF